MDLEEILEMWKKDSVIDEFKLDDTTIKKCQFTLKILESYYCCKNQKETKENEL